MTNQPKKIGILTYTSNFNYGTFFQAYATLCAVRRHFPNSNVEIVNYNSKSKSQQIGYNKLNLARRHIYPPYLVKHLFFINYIYILDFPFIIKDFTKKNIRNFSAKVTNTGAWLSG
jgi:hypothetical protein